MVACAAPKPSALEQASTTLPDHALPEPPPPPPDLVAAPPNAASAPASPPATKGAAPASAAGAPAAPPVQPAAGKTPTAAAGEPAASPAAKPPSGPYESELVRYDGENILLKGRVGFDSSHRFVEEGGRKILDEVARLLESRPEIARVEIQGHRHSRMETGGEKITQMRANAVRDYLIGKGINGARLKAVGYEAQVPIDTNRTAEGRAANTRIELVVLERKP